MGGKYTDSGPPHQIQTQSSRRRGVGCVTWSGRACLSEPVALTPSLHGLHTAGPSMLSGWVGACSTKRCSHFLGGQAVVYSGGGCPVHHSYRCHE
jgi:hypothetical protein